MKKLLLFCLLVIIDSTFLFPQSNDILKYDVKARIDSVWGPGNTSKQLFIFDSVWTLIDQKFACFQNLDLDWNAVKEKYRPEIAQGVSRGRFGAMLSHLCLSLKEPHTAILDQLVRKPGTTTRGIPVVSPAGRGLPGAGVTPLPDSSLLVYRTIDQHPLGFKPGDIVLGYDGIPWKQLYQKLIDLEVPIDGGRIFGANDAASTYHWLQAAGTNWYLFDTIDVVKHSSKDTVHLPTHSLDTMNVSLRFTDQIPVPGIPFPENPYNTSVLVRWGIVEGTTIGYVYVWSWFDFSTSTRFYNALDSLTRIYNVSGLILDFRSNNGGYVNNSDDALRLLFNSSPPTFFLAERSDPFNHFIMAPYGNFSLPDDSARFYDKPIAVLTGPQCVSACDFISLRMKSHPKARFFGLTTAAAYSSPEDFILDSQVRVQYTFLNGFENENAPHYLTHEEFQVDEKVWHTPDAAVKGEDAVVHAALAWIQSVTAVVADNSSPIPEDFALGQNYPNPFNPATTIAYRLPTSAHVTLTVFDAIGRQVKILVNEEKPAGSHSLKFDATGLSSGVYFYSLRSGSFAAVKKMVVMK